MAIPRKDALRRLQDLVPELEKHLAEIVSEPDAQARSHWKGEVENWLRQMERMLRHVGKKTSAEWQRRIEIYRQRLESQTGPGE
jgi:hypothetical protein